MSVDEALAQAAAENGLASDYVDIVRPLLRDPPERWPRCCGGGCEPCALQLVRVAERALALLGTRKP
jgi:hypothetical protein